MVGLDMLEICPLTLADANDLVTRLHRHHRKVRGHRFSLGLREIESGKLIGAAIIGRPVARQVDSNLVAEVTRLVTDGTPNACSILYGAAARCAKEMGFEKIQTYTLESESGSSLKASGWECVALTRGGKWQRVDFSIRMHDQPDCKKLRWEKFFSKKHKKIISYSELRKAIFK